MLEVLIIGSDGQLGSCIKEISGLEKYSSLNFSFVDKQDLNLEEPDQINDYFSNKTFNYIINCAAYTAVDKAEEEKGIAFKINTDAVGYIASNAKKQNAILIHVSTDYVFNGMSEKPYQETHSTDPINVYGKSKLNGEVLALKNNPSRTYILRTSWLYSAYGNNFLKSMLRLFSTKDSLNIVADQFGCPTSAHDLAFGILEIILSKKEFFGVYHFSNKKATTWFDFACKIKELINSTVQIGPITTSEYPTAAKRPMYSVMNCEKIIKNFDLEINDWDISLKNVMSKLK